MGGFKKEESLWNICRTKLFDTTNDGIIKCQLNICINKSKYNFKDNSFLSFVSLLLVRLVCQCELLNLDQRVIHTTVLFASVQSGVQESLQGITFLFFFIHCNKNSMEYNLLTLKVSVVIIASNCLKTSLPHIYLILFYGHLKLVAF